MRRRVLRVYTVRLCLINRTPGLYGSHSSSKLQLRYPFGLYQVKIGSSDSIGYNETRNWPMGVRYNTVTPVLLKILEHILNARHNDLFSCTQSHLQRGFTEECSSLNAAVILTECILESASNKQDLWLTTLDTQKAFDVVVHSSLLRRLYLDGIHGDDWLLVKDLYTYCSSRIKWAGGLSHPINIRQGVRQGGVLSTSHYKR